MSKSFPIQLIYASTSGNVEIVMQHVAKILTQHGFSPVLHRAEQTSIEVIHQHSTFVLATSTWEHGALNPFFNKLYAEMKSSNFQGKAAAFVGLGDRRYEPVLYCEGMEKVRRVWLNQGGVEVLQSLKINGEPYALLEILVTPWATKLASALITQRSRSSSILQSIRQWLAHD